MTIISKESIYKTLIATLIPDDFLSAKITIPKPPYPNTP